MIKILVQDNRDRNTVIVDPALTIRQAIEEAGLSASGNGALLNGRSLTASDMDRTLEELGATEDSYISLVTKTNNA